MTVVRGAAARRLMARTQHAGPVLAAAPRVAARPPDQEPVRWALVAGAPEVAAAGGMPARIRTELVELLDGSFGAEAGGITRRASTLTDLLLDDGSAGELRVSGTQRHLLVELIRRETAGAGADAPDRPAPDLPVSAGTTYGHYRTLGEARTQHVRWARCPLPVAAEDGRSQPPAADVWD